MPLPQAVALELSAHLAAHPACEVTLPWQRVDEPAAAATLILTSRERKALNRNYVNTSLWSPALAAAGLERVRSNGMPRYGTGMPQCCWSPG